MVSKDHSSNYSEIAMHLKLTIFLLLGSKRVNTWAVHPCSRVCTYVELAWILFPIFCALHTQSSHPLNIFYSAGTIIRATNNNYFIVFTEIHVSPRIPKPKRVFYYPVQLSIGHSFWLTFSPLLESLVIDWLNALKNLKQWLTFTNDFR